VSDPGRKIKLQVTRVVTSQSQLGSYVLILSEVNGKMRLPIVIGNFEAQSIVIVLEKMIQKRPLTHDLFLLFIEKFGIVATEVLIHKLEEGVFHSVIKLSDGVSVREIDARTSDAIALALRFDCPIYVYEHVLGAAGIYAEDDHSEGDHSLEEDAPDLGSSGIREMSQSELTDALSRALEEEEYEKASEIRDEMKRRFGL
jgi:bifunctional DNase/RNase